MSTKSKIGEFSLISCIIYGLFYSKFENWRVCWEIWSDLNKNEELQPVACIKNTKRKLFKICLRSRLQLSLKAWAWRNLFANCPVHFSKSFPYNLQAEFVERNRLFSGKMRNKILMILNKTTHLGRRKIINPRNRFICAISVIQCAYLLPPFSANECCVLHKLSHFRLRTVPNLHNLHVHRFKTNTGITVQWCKETCFVLLVTGPMQLTTH